MIIKNAKLESDPLDPVQAEWISSPNSYSRLTPKKIVIHYTQAPHWKSPVNTFKAINKPSAHLIVPREGGKVIQMVHFSKKAKHTIKNNTDTIGIELDYGGYLVENTHQDHWRNPIHYPENERLYGYYMRGERYETWPLYPIEQIETVFFICQFLIKAFPEIDSIVGHEDLEAKPDPGPAFPMTYFQEQLLGDKKPGQVLSEVTHKVDLRTRPGKNSPKISGGKISAKKAVSVFDDEDPDWVMVEVMEPEDGNRWKVGWMPKKHLKHREYQLVIKDHLLFGKDEDGTLRQYTTKTPHKNNYGKEFSNIENLRYLIMHYTAATTMNSTINHFTAEHFDVASRASAHLLIGRDGSIVQFLPFNVVAYHCGYSFWEGLEGINFYSIGIEMVNAGYIKIDENGNYIANKRIVPATEVQKDVKHWKQLPSQSKPWHIFTKIQLEVAHKIAEAIIDHYKLDEILGHDQINLKEKLDPGPMFPMEKWRTDFFERDQPKVERWKISEKYRKAEDLELEELKKDKDLKVLKFYENQNYEPPHPNHKMFQNGLKFGTKIKRIKQKGRWLLINANGRTGWIRDRPGTYTINNEEKGEGKIKRDGVTFYKKFGGSVNILPPIENRFIPLAPGMEVRLQFEKNNWALIASCPGEAFFEGWIIRDAIEKIEEIEEGFVPNPHNL